jgi:2'-5' RNA ligase
MRSSERLESEGTLCHLLLMEQTPTLMCLHRELQALLGPAGRLLSPDTGRFEGAGYNPHVTIAYGSTPDEFRRFTARLAGYDPHFEFEVRSVELSCFEPGRPDPIRSAAQVFPLGER